MEQGRIHSHQLRTGGQGGKARFPSFGLVLTDQRTDKRTEKASYRVTCPQLKTTIKKRFKPKPSEETKKPRRERRECKKQYENETDLDLKPKLLEKYVAKQNEIREKAIIEEQDRRSLIAL